MDMFPCFELGDLELFGSTQFSTHYRGFLLTTLLLEMLHCLFFKSSETIDSLKCQPNFLFSDFYESLLFNFRMEPSLGFPCLILFMFIVISIIRIIKTTCFDNTILIARLERKLP